MRARCLAVLAAGAALGLWAEWAALRPGPFEHAVSAAETRLAIGDLAVGIVLLGCGVAAWSTNPGSRMGQLLTLAGMTWFLGTFAASGESGYADFGALFVTLHRGPLVHALLSHPSGRVDRRSERGGIAAAYVLAAIGAAYPAGTAIALASILAVFTAFRVTRALGPERRARLTAAAASAAFCAILVAAAAARLADAGPSVDRAVLWAYQLVVAGISILLTLDLLLGRWVRATVASLVVDLGERVEAGTLRDRLARALGDRSLVVAYHLPERGAFVDERGLAVQLPEEDGDRRVTIVEDRGEPVAALVHRGDVVGESELAASVAAAARLAVSNTRLEAEVRRQVEELEASRRRLLEAADAERRRLEVELRGGPERRLVEVETLLERASVKGDGPFAEALAEAKREVERARTELREFARGIHPRVLGDRGLPAALRDLAARSAADVELKAPNRRFSPAVEAAAYFVCAEALTNVDKYAGASAVLVEVLEARDSLIVAVTDDGSGGATLDAGSGLRGLADRLEAMGGRLTVTSPRGGGTRVVAEIPLG